MSALESDERATKVGRPLSRLRKAVNQLAYTGNDSNVCDTSRLTEPTPPADLADDLSSAFADLEQFPNLRQQSIQLLTLGMSGSRISAFMADELTIRRRHSQIREAFY